jgi:hypothetical protein
VASLATQYSNAVLAEHVALLSAPEAVEVYPELSTYGFEYDRK